MRIPYKLIKHKAAAIAGALIVVMTLSNCSEDLLDITDPNRLSPDLFWLTAEDAEKALVGVYGPLTTWDSWGRIVTARLTMHRSDIVNPFPQSQVNGAGTLTLLPTDIGLRRAWAEVNTIVARANQVIANVPAIKMDEARKVEILGEAHFLRGFAHFYLLNMWGHIPLIKEPIHSHEDLVVEQASQEEVWNSIIADLLEAQKSLPETWPSSDVGRATWGAATAMLGKAFLYTQEWEGAAAEFRKIIDSKLYSLTANYQDNFLASGNNNEESIFELQYERTIDRPNGASGTPNHARAQAWEPDMAPKGYTSQQSVSINNWVFDLFMKERNNAGEIDSRAYVTILWNYPGAQVYQDDFTEAFSGANLNRIWVRKYLNFERNSSLTPGSWGYSDNNYRMIRFSDVLLMYAEAENEVNGPSPEVYNAIHRVRERVDMPDITAALDQTGMRKIIREERVLELALEGNRYYDLLRWGIAADVFEQHPEYRSNSGGVFVRGKHEYLPIPQNDIDTNPKIKQNNGH